MRATVYCYTNHDSTHLFDSEPVLCMISSKEKYTVRVDSKSLQMEDGSEDENNNIDYDSHEFYFNF